MTLLTRVSAFIKAQPDKRFCDGCIKSETNAPSYEVVNEATRHLSKAGTNLGFFRSHDVCNICGEVRLVIYAL